MNTQKFYELLLCEHVIQKEHCKLCGVFVTAQHQAYKTTRYFSTIQQTSQRYLTALNKKNKSIPILKEKIDIQETIFDFLQKIVEKFQFSIQTFSLGIYLYNRLVQTSKKPDYLNQMEFYTTVCLMVAAKAIQLDKNIPYFSRYQKYACKHYSRIEYQKAEKQIIEFFEFQIQIPTFITYIHFYLANGIVFSNQDFNKKKVYSVQQKVRELVYKSLKTGTFVSQDQQKWAAIIINNARKQYKLKWNHIFQKYSHFVAQEIQENDISILKPLQNPKINLYNTEIKNQSRNYQKLRENSNVKGKDKICGINKIRLHTLKQVPSFHALNIVSIKRFQN